MNGIGANGNGSPARSGTRALGLLAKPLNGTILHRLADAPMRLVDLRRECGSPAQTTLRTHLRELEELGTIAKQRRTRFPGALEYELEAPGEELLFVLEALERWLEQAPEGPLEFGTRGARAATKALVEAWSSTMLRALAARPLSLTELDGIIGGLNYPSLERRLAAMRLAGQVVACDGDGGGTPYRVTEWLRRGVAPLAAAARWERRHAPDSSAAIARVDAEATFLLSLPLLRLPAEMSGSCRMGVEMKNGGERRLVGATAQVEQGKVASCTAHLQGDADAWATGSAMGWLHAVTGSDMDGLEMGGDQRLVRSLVEGLHKVLFRSARRARTRAR
ncbi:MAG TPA: winged helix-turn-helix transcriptional regulator [Solirubrobacterales bacterium]